MIKNILWDFDGVILDSMKIKGDGFVELFKEYDSIKVQELEKYHYDNGGISRFEKIKYFFHNILKQPVTEDEVLKHANNFANIIEKKLYNSSNLIDDSVNFIKKNHKEYNFHIVSGAEHEELNKICKYLSLDKYFLSINGSPIKKDILVKDILKKYKYKIKETILIGDSINDYNAADVSGIAFRGYNNIELKQCDKYIDSFKGFRI